jgi:hypothetical protein
MSRIGYRLSQTTSARRSDMRVTVEDVPQVEVGNKGILIRIRDEDGSNLGKLWIGQAHIRWARGSVPEGNAKKLSVKKFVEYLNSLT